MIFCRRPTRLPPPSPSEDVVDGPDDIFLHPNDVPRRTPNNTAQSSSNSCNQASTNSSTDNSTKPPASRELPDIHDVPYDSPPPPPLNPKTKAAAPCAKREDLYSNTKIKKGDRKTSRQPGTCYCNSLCTRGSKIAKHVTVIRECHLMYKLCKTSIEGYQSDRKSTLHVYDSIV